jgi:hypothetical protein
MTRDVVAAAVVVILVGWAFYSTLGGHAEPKPGAAGVHDLTGMTNPHVTQQNIRSTICRHGWDASVRPSSGEAWELKRSLLHGRRASDYELDHIIPIGLGGAVLDRRNLQLQRWSGVCNARMKDELERQLSIMVCAGDATLTGAQHEIGTDWRTAYKKWIDSKGCGEE